MVSDDPTEDLARLRHEVEATVHHLVLDFFEGDREKTRLWHEASNQMLGNVSPKNLFALSRHATVLRFVREAREASRPPQP